MVGSEIRAVIMWERGGSIVGGGEGSIEALGGILGFICLGGCGPVVRRLRIVLLFRVRRLALW